MNSDMDDVIEDLQKSWSKSDAVESRSCPKCGQPMKYWQTREGKHFWACQKCKLDIPTSIIAFKTTFITMPLWRKIVQFFIHGACFSIMFLVFVFCWDFIGSFLVEIGSFLGLIIVIIGFIFICGIVNTAMSALVWDLSVKSSLGYLLIHGFLVFIVFLVIELALLLPMWTLLENPVIVATTFIARCFLYGFVGLKVAEKWAQ